MKYGEGWAYDFSRSHYKRAKPTGADPEDDRKTPPLPHQEINGSLSYDRMERCQVWQEILQMPALQLIALRASMKVKETQ